MEFVVDCSVTIAWFMPDEEEPLADRVLSLLSDGQALVPALWSLEVSNALIVAERQKRLTKLESSGIWRRLKGLPIKIEQFSSNDVEEIMTLAREHRLSAYDAAYLELARERNLPLATLDAKLRRAAKAIKLPAMDI